MKYSALSLITALLIAPAGLGAMSHKADEAGAHKAHGHAHGVQKAVAVIVPTEGNDTAGHVVFTRVKNGVRVEGRITGLTPGMHGFHVHEYGDLRADDGTSAGGHFNPKGKPHGGPDAKMRHVGDLGNIEADADGTAEFSFVDRKLSFEGAASILGRGLIVHAGEDDLESQPTGAAGPRVGMGVIGVAGAAM